VALALLAGAGWWVVRAPAVPRADAAPPPDVDIEPAAMRARREAAIALATMPDDPWSFAESLAASAPEKTVEKEQCGIGDGPQFSEQSTDGEMPVLTRAASSRYVSAQARMDAALRASADPLDRAVADLINTGDMRSAAGRDEAVVQQAAVSADPRLYALGYGLCHSAREAAPSCARISLARWAQIDTGNGTPWLHALAQAETAGDAAGERDAMAHLAAASRFDTYVFAASAAVARRVSEGDPDLAAARDLMTRALLQALAASPSSFQTLIQVCRNHAGGDEALERQCRGISDTMFEHSDNLLDESISGGLLLQTTGDPSRRDLVHAERVVFG
jgi:hypothetical protein